MHEVMGRAVLMLTQNARAAGAATETALAKVGLTEAELSRRGCRVDWDRFAAFLTELEGACGGPAGIAQALEQGYPRGSVDFLPVLGALVSPRELFRFVHGVVFPLTYRVVDCVEHDTGRGTFRVEYRIPPPHASCPAFFHATAGAMRSVPCMFGQPPARVELEAGEREATFLIMLPPSPTLWARARRFVSQRWLRRTVEEVEHSWIEMHRQMELLEREAEARVRAENALRAALDALSARSGDDGSRDERGSPDLHDGLSAPTARLTPRETEVTRLLLKGCTYDEIAQVLGVSSNTVRSFIRSIYEKLEVNSRTEEVVEALRLRLIDGP